MKSKYEDKFPTLAEGFARQGLKDTQIAHNLGIGVATFYDYQKKHPEFREAIKNGKRPVDMEAENAFLKRVMGFDYKEKVIEYHAPDPKVPDSVPIVKSVREITKKVLPDVTAGIFWMMNRMPERWRDKSKLAEPLQANSLRQQIAEMSQAERDTLKRTLIKKLEEK